MVDAWLAEHTVDLIQWRRHIHANPELSRTEFGTTEFVATWLTKAGLTPRVLPGGTGLICDIGPDTPRIALRADMDALPMQEFTGLSFASTVPGVSHACGHDAHTTILLGTALALAEADLPVGVRLVFQPAEEVMPGGALDVVAAGAMAGVERIFALHCDPRLEVGRVGVRVGAITSAADTVELVLDSPGGHTSRPHLTSDLVYAIGTVITGLPGLLSRRIDPRTSTVMVWGAVSAGKAPNAIPQTGMLTGTVRTGDHATWSLLEPMVHEIVDGLLAPTGVRYQLNYRRGGAPGVNAAHDPPRLGGGGRGGGRLPGCSATLISGVGCRFFRSALRPRRAHRTPRRPPRATSRLLSATSVPRRNDNAHAAPDAGWCERHTDL
ncbi:amidohydrolase, partial [Nocardia cyriacigeorgica]|uniref:amidohydrolase n=1 Tax=Nocardia cyriacigeorgica TaxID=135487 RepID=UPI0024555BCE